MIRTKCPVNLPHKAWCFFCWSLEMPLKQFESPRGLERRYHVACGQPFCEINATKRINGTDLRPIVPCHSAVLKDNHSVSTIVERTPCHSVRVNPTMNDWRWPIKSETNKDEVPMHDGQYILRSHSIHSIPERGNARRLCADPGLLASPCPK